MIPTVHKQEPAFSVIESLGGKSKVARTLKLDRSALSRWCMPRPRGTGGLIPQQHWPALMRLGQRQGVSLTLEQLAGLKG